MKDGECTTCKIALVAYFKAKEATRRKTKKKKREAAARSRQKRKEKFAKIEAEHEALTRQQKSQEAFLNQLAQDKFQLWQLIKKKTHERNSRREMMAHNLAKELVKCPKDILNHLEQEIATSITTDTHPNNTY